MIPYMIDAHKNAHMAIEFVDQVGFVAVSLSAAKPADLIIGCIWNKLVLYKRKRGDSWIMDTIVSLFESCAASGDSCVETRSIASNESICEQERYIVKRIVEHKSLQVS